MSTPGRETRRILITVKTYPTPSMGYAETVCVAGVDIDRNEWIRLYPVPFRDLPGYRQFHKYSVVEVSVRKHTQDPRPESYDPDWQSFRVLDFVDTADEWHARRMFLQPRIRNSMCEIMREQRDRGVSLGCFSPAQVVDFIIEDDAPDWTGRQREAMAQLRLFQGPGRRLEKIPFKFFYRCLCSDPECTGHRQRLLDWEVYQLYRRLHREGASVEKVKELIRRKFLDELCAPSRDTHFFVGNHSSHHNAFMILGVFWPPRQQPSLFD
ncbi:hypothetical protein HQ560_02940 [bacterium]|nr:hypothetical protein [bacterium]